MTTMASEIDVDHLVRSARSLMAAQDQLQAAVDRILEPTSSGYLHANERWAVVAFRDDRGVRLGLDPPEHAYEWDAASIEGLQEIKAKLGCDELRAIAINPGRVRYIALWRQT